MGQHRVKRQPPPRRRPWRRAALGGFVVVVSALAASWWFLGSPETSSGGTPRLVVDREVVDLGYFPFGASARAVFTLTNAGDGSLRLTDVPPVQVVKGC